MARPTEPTGPKPPLVGLVKMQVNWNGPGTPTPIAANILHGKWSDNLNHSATDLATVATALSNAINVNIIPAVAATWKMIGVQVQSLGGDGNEGFNSVSFNGGTLSTTLPPQCTICTSWTSTATWRGGRPRTYWPGIPAADLVSGYDAALTGGAISAWATASAGLLSALNGITAGGASFAMGFPSYFTKYAFRPTPVFFPFTGVRIHGRIDSQRRRTGKERYFV